MATTAEQWAARALEIETAIHNLATGSRVVEISSPDGTRVQYQEADIAKLQQLYDWTLAQQTKAAAPTSPRGPIYISPFE